MQHNKRKAGSVLSSVTGSEQAEKRRRYDSTMDQTLDQLDDENDEGPRYFMPEDENEGENDGDEGDYDGNEDHEELKPSLQAIKELEDLTLKEPKNINAWLQLERKLTKSFLPKKYELSLACLAEGLNFNPTNGKLWRRYWILFNQTYPEADRNDDFRKKKIEIKEFCEENVDLGCNDFWTKYINMEKTISSKAEVLEKYIARLLPNQISYCKWFNSSNSRRMELTPPRNFELQFASAILYRAYLMTLDGSTNDAKTLILDFIKLCPQFYSSNSPELEEYECNHDPDSEIDFHPIVKLGLALSTTHLVIQNELPQCFQQSRFKILAIKDFDFKSELVKFDTKLIKFNLGKLHSDFKFNLDSESIALLTELNKLVGGTNYFEENWDSDYESLVLQLYELIERADNTIIDIARQVPFWSACSFWSTAFDLLTFYLSIHSGEEVQSAFDKYLLYQYTDPELTHMEPTIGFVLAYHMYELDNEEGLANALTYLEATIGN